MINNRTQRYEWQISGRGTVWHFVGFFALFAVIVLFSPFSDRGCDGGLCVMGIIIFGGLGLLCWAYNLVIVWIVSRNVIQQISGPAIALVSAAVLPLVITSLLLAGENDWEGWQESMIPFSPVIAFPTTVLIRILGLRKAERDSWPLS